MTPLHDDQAEPPDEGCPACGIIFGLLLSLLIGTLLYVALALPELPPLPNDGVRRMNGLDREHVRPGNHG